MEDVKDTYRELAPELRDPAPGTGEEPVKDTAGSSEVTEGEAVHQEYDEPEDLDNSGPNYSQALRTDTGPGDTPPKKPDLFSLLFKVMFGPVEGWKAVRRSRVTVEQAQQGCFYPLVALVAIGRFAELFYAPRTPLSDVVVAALSAFVSFFAGYFCIMILLQAILPAKCLDSAGRDFSKVFVTMSLSTLCVFCFALEVLPTLWAVLVFLPLWTVYIVCKGVRFFKFPGNREIRYTALVCLLIVAVPSGIDWVLNQILPN